MTMLSRSQHVAQRLLYLSRRAISIHNHHIIFSSVALRRHVCAFHPLALRNHPDISISLSPRSSPFTTHLLHTRSSSSRSSSFPSVPDDEYEELKHFLATPMTSGAAMERAKEIVMDWMQQYVHPAMPGQDATVMVMVADAMQNPEFVIDVYTCLRDAGVSPSPITLEYSAAACAELGQWRTALEIIDYMHQAVEIMQPSLNIYENAIVSCHAAKKWMKAKHLLEEMRTYRLEASPELHVASIRLCIDNKEATATKVLVKAFLRAYDQELEREVKQEIVTGLFHAALDVESLSQALYFRDELLARHFPISKELYSRLVHLCAIKRQWHKARTLLQQFVDINAPPPAAAPSNRYTDDIRRLFDDMQKHGIEIPLTVYNAALRNFGQMSLGDDALAVYSKMRDRSVTLDATSYAALMCSCGTQVEQSEDFFCEMKRNKSDPTLDVAHAYLLVPSRAKQWKEVLRRYAVVHDEEPLFKDLPFESDVRIQALVAVAYGRLHRSKEMLCVFTRMKVNGMTPNLYVYGEAMFAYIRQDQWRYALMLFDHLFQQQTPEMQEKRKLEKFPMLWDAAVLACLKGEQAERAAMLYDTIVEHGVSISMVTGERLAAMLTSVPSGILWRSFKSIPSLHRTQTSSRLNPRVQNAVLRRAVEENDQNLAEQIVTDGLQKMNMLPNSMTFALMLRLYANCGNQKSFHSWWCKMDENKVKPTLFVFRALMHQLSNLSLDCEDLAYINAVGDFMRKRQPRDLITGVVNNENVKEYAAELGRAALDIMEDCVMSPDTICLQYYLLLSQEPDHVDRVLVLVEKTMAAINVHDEGSTEGCVHLTPRLLHTLITTLYNFPDGQRVRKLLMQIVKDLPSDISEDAVAAYCAANDGHHALQLLRELLDAKICLNDEQILFFLTNSYTCESSIPKSEHSRPRSAYGVIVEMSLQLCESETVTIEAGCLAFLIQQVVELSKWQEQDVFEIATEDEIQAMKKLLVRAFAHFPISQVTEFLSKVIAKDDFVHAVSVLDELQGVPRKL